MTETSTAPKSTDVLAKAATQYAAAKASDVVSKLGDRASGAVTGKSGQSGDSNGDDGEDKKGFIGATAEKIGEGASPVKAAVSGVGTSIKEGFTNLFKGKGGAKRPNNIVEDCYVGIPVEQAFAAWTDYEEWAKFSKGIENVNRKDGDGGDDGDEGDEDAQEETNWTAKVFLSRRSWNATTTDFDPPNRIAWTSEGAKGTIDGTVTFTPVGENATLILVVMEYRGKGPIEWIANRWRAAERRARLDIKHFRRYAMRSEPDELPEPEEPEESTEEPSDEAPEEPSEEPTDGDETDEPDEPDEPDQTDEEDTESEEQSEPEPQPASATRSRPTRRPRG